MKFVLINGPKRSGKSTFVKLCAKESTLPHTAVIGFSFHLKRFVHGIYLGKQGFRMDPDAFDAVKEEPQELLGGMSWRQVYIHYSENVIKPLHGKEWFGNALLRAAAETAADAVFVPDSGFREEAERVVRDAGAKNVLLVRLHRDGHFYDASDSRGYIHLDDLGVDEMNILNPEDDAATLKAHARIVDAWLKGEPR